MKYMILAALLGSTAPMAHATEYVVQREDALFAAVLKKAGIAKAMAHNHIIRAADYDLRLNFNSEQPAESVFRLALPAENLRADEPEMRAKWDDTFIGIGILEHEFKDLDESKRADIRESMLGEEQLDAAAYPQIVMELTALSRRAGEDGTYDATMALTLHGRTVEEAMEVEITEVDGGIQVEGIGSYKFTQFGIEPYSAFLGAVQNQDQFYVYTQFTAAPAGTAGAS